MKITPTEKAVGQILAYDTTVVTPEKSSTLLKRGHRITKNDIDTLKNSGVYQIWTKDNDNSTVYEWEISSTVAKRLTDSETTRVIEGRHGIAFLVSKIPGLIKVDGKRLVKFNLNGDVLIITRSDNQAVGKGEIIAAVDVIPIGVNRKRMEKISSLASSGIVRILPFKSTRIGLVITGTEIYENRRKDQYFSILKKKCRKYGWKITSKTIVPDDQDREVEAIKKAKDEGVDAIIVTGGMSVDPTDRTSASIRKLGAKIIAYGVPMKPTTMSLIAMWKDLPIFAISAGGIRYSDFNSIDVLFARIMAGIIPTKREIAELGLGGMFPSYEININREMAHHGTK